MPHECEQVEKARSQGRWGVDPCFMTGPIHCDWCKGVLARPPQPAPLRPQPPEVNHQRGLILLRNPHGD
jgi:hypothetical protein